MLLDGDVYLTGSRHPLSGMLPLSDPTWSIQFQSDDFDGNNSAINIGWYWARPSPVIREYFIRSYKLWNQTHEWDQRVMNRVRFEMMSEGTLSYPKSIALKVFDYTSFLLLRNWTTIFIDTNLIDQLRSERISIHQTGLGSLYKHFMAKHLGLWFNETYYTRPIRLLQPINLSGSDADMLTQFALSVHLAKASGRTFMWPMYVNSTGQTGIIERKPPLQIVHVQSVANTVPWVEATYLHNRARYSPRVFTENIISANLPSELRSSWITRLTEDCLSISADVLKVDFAGVDLDQLAMTPGIEDIWIESALWRCWDDQEICRFYYVRAS